MTDHNNGIGSDKNSALLAYVMIKLPGAPLIARNTAKIQSFSKVLGHDTKVMIFSTNPAPPRPLLNVVSEIDGHFVRKFAWISKPTLIGGRGGNICDNRHMLDIGEKW